MRRTNAFSTALLLGTALLSTAGSASSSTSSSATGETCRGLPVTIHSTARSVQGTEGDDVVLVEYTRDGGSVSTYGGDDVVCFRGDDPDYELPGSIQRAVDVGDGDDVVDGTQATTLNLSVDLGAGSDRFEGGPVWNQVMAGDWVDGAHADTEVDVLVGGDRRDWFRSGTLGQPNGDQVDLRAGDDRVELAGYWAEGGFLRGAGGEDTLSLEPTSESSAFDTTAGTYIEDGRTAAVLDGFDRYLVDSRDRPGQLTFLGSEADEFLYTVGLTVTAQMAGGDDDVSLYWVRDGTVVDGGPGRDGYSTEIFGPEVLALDLRSGDLRVGAGETAYRARVTGFEDADVDAARIRLAGTDGPNRLSVTSCGLRSTVRGRGGDDRLTVRKDPEVFGRGCDGFTLSGGPGNDVLTGGPRHDRLVGGAGEDAARGRKGRDRCSAEIRQGCER